MFSVAEISKTSIHYAQWRRFSPVRTTPKLRYCTVPVERYPSTFTTNIASIQNVTRSILKYLLWPCLRHIPSSPPLSTSLPLLFSPSLRQTTRNKPHRRRSRHAPILPQLPSSSTSPSPQKPSPPPPSTPPHLFSIKIIARGAFLLPRATTRLSIDFNKKNFFSVMQPKQWKLWLKASRWTKK